MRAEAEVSLGGFGGIRFTRKTQAQYAQQMIGETQAREAVREFAVGYVVAQIAIDALEAIALAIGEYRFKFAAERFEGRLETSHRGADRSGGLQFRGRVRTMALEIRGALVNRENVSRDHPRADYIFGADAAVAHKVEDECRAGQIDEFVNG